MILSGIIHKKKLVKVQGSPDRILTITNKIKYFLLKANKFQNCAALNLMTICINKPKSYSSLKWEISNNRIKYLSSHYIYIIIFNIAISIY